MTERTTQTDNSKGPRNLCGRRITKGKEPGCVKGCQAAVRRFGKIEELAKGMKEKPRTVLWFPHW